MKKDLERILLSADQISERIMEIAQEIDAYYNQREILIISLLDGSIIFTADLIRNLTVPIRLDCLRVSSYGNSVNPETAPRIIGSLKSEVRDKDVLLIDDILDTGMTMSKVHEEIMNQNPASLKTCVFLDKPQRRQVAFNVDWKGFSIPDKFVVGYGLDYAGRYRQLPFLGILKPEVYQADNLI